MSKALAFKIGDKVTIEEQSTDGDGDGIDIKVVGVAEYEDAQPSYLVRHRNEDGVSVENWWSAKRLALAN